MGVQVRIPRSEWPDKREGRALHTCLRPRSMPPMPVNNDTTFILAYSVTLRAVRTPYSVNFRAVSTQMAPRRRHRAVCSVQAS